MTGPRDWDKEMAEIDKVIAGGNSAAAPRAAVPAVRDASQKGPVAEPRTTVVVTRKRDAFGVWLRALVGVGGVVALNVWPYAKGCGTMLYLYIACAAVVAMFGGWTMRGAWVHRRGVAHVAGLLVFIAGLSLIAIQVLQRTGYAATRLGWTCP